MEKEEIPGTMLATSTLRWLGTSVFFAAMLLAITLEGACVYWLWLSGAMRTPSGIQASLVGQWTSATLPQCWLLGAVAVLIYRVTLMLVPPRSWVVVDLLHNRRAFIRLWRWVVAVAAMQIWALYLDRVVMAVQ